MLNTLQRYADLSVHSNTQAINYSASDILMWDAESDKHINIDHSRNIEFLMLCGVSEAQQLPVDKERALSFLSKHIDVLKCMDRAAVVRIGKLVFYADCFGVIATTYIYRDEELSGFPVTIMARLKQLIHLLMGSFQKWDGRDNVYDYSRCEQAYQAA